MDEITRYNDQGGQMIEVARYMIDTTKDHIRFFDIVRQHIRRNDNVITDYAAMLDSILTVAYKLVTGTGDDNTVHDAEWEMIETYFGQTSPQPVLDSIKQCIMDILEYYTKTIISLGISANRVLFINNADRKGILIGEYNIEHLSDKE